MSTSSAVNLEELNRRISEFMGMPWRKPTHGTCCTCQTCGLPNDTECGCGWAEDIEKAWQVVEKLLNDGYVVTLVRDRDALWECRFAQIEGSVDVRAYAPTAPEAICRAALAAVEGR